VRRQSIDPTRSLHDADAMATDADNESTPVTKTGVINANLAGAD
jgi:hypothetical protein